MRKILLVLFLLFVCSCAQEDYIFLCPPNGVIRTNVPRQTLISYEFFAGSVLNIMKAVLPDGATFRNVPTDLMEYVYYHPGERPTLEHVWGKAICFTPPTAMRGTAFACTLITDEAETCAFVWVILGNKPKIICSADSFSIEINETVYCEIQVRDDLDGDSVLFIPPVYDTTLLDVSIELILDDVSTDIYGLHIVTKSNANFSRYITIAADDIDGRAVKFITVNNRLATLGIPNLQLNRFANYAFSSTAPKIDTVHLGDSIYFMLCADDGTRLLRTNDLSVFSTFGKRCYDVSDFDGDGGPDYLYKEGDSLKIDYSSSPDVSVYSDTNSDGMFVCSGDSISRIFIFTDYAITCLPGSYLCEYYSEGYETYNRFFLPDTRRVAYLFDDRLTYLARSYDCCYSSGFIGKYSYSAKGEWYDFGCPFYYDGAEGFASGYAHQSSLRFRRFDPVLDSIVPTDVPDYELSGSLDAYTELCIYAEGEPSDRYIAIIGSAIDSGPPYMKARLSDGTEYVRNFSGDYSHLLMLPWDGYYLGKPSASGIELIGVVGDSLRLLATYDGCYEIPVASVWAPDSSVLVLMRNDANLHLYNLKRTTEIRKKWNLLSYPTATPINPRDVIPHVITDVWKWNIDGYYLPAETLRAGEGFFFFAPIDFYLPQVTSEIESLDIDLFPGWNCIGSIAKDYDVSTLGIGDAATFFEYNPYANTFVSTTLLKPYRGYFVLSTDTLHLHFRP